MCDVLHTIETIIIKPQRMCRGYSSQLGLSVLQHEDPRQYMLPGGRGRGESGIGVAPKFNEAGV